MMNVRRLARRIQGAFHDGLAVCGVDQYKRREDRRVLERVIFPYFLRRPEFARILFVGCGWYTKVYAKIFRGKDYWTLEIDPTLRRFGAGQHVTDALQNVCDHFEPGWLDLILCNGVFGWGLDAPEEADAAFAACFACLREGGVLVVGWNDVPEHRPFPLTESVSLQSFRAYDFPPLGTSRYLVADSNRHTYHFFVKRARD